MSNPYERAKTGRLIFKGGGDIAATKSIDKNKKKKKKHRSISTSDEPQPPSDQQPLSIETNHEGESAEAEDIYSIDAAKKMKYDELFPVEAKKFRYDPKAKSTSVEQALDDRVKKKADRYCKWGRA